MSLDDHRGKVFYLRELHKQVQAEIASGERKGVTVKFAYRAAKLHRVSRRLLQIVRRAS